MDLLKKFDAVEICTDDRITETDRQFLQREQAIYQDAAAGFYQIAALWMDMRIYQKAALSEPEDISSEWKEKYLVSRWWRDLSVKSIIEHIFSVHRKFVSTVVTYLNSTYYLTLDVGDIAAALLPEMPDFLISPDLVDWSAFPPVILRYENAVDLILSSFDGRTFEEQAPYELVQSCQRMAWDENSRSANFEQKKSLVKFLGGACGYGYHNHYEQWYVTNKMKVVLKALAHFEAGCFGQYPDGLDVLLSDEKRLWYDLWEFEECEKLERIKMFKNGRMDIRFTNEGFAREFVSRYLGTVW